MKKIIIMIVCVFLCCSLFGCRGPLVEIPPAHVAKLSDKNGLLPGLKHPSKFRLSAQMPGTIGNSLILAEASDYPTTEEMEIFIPKDQLNLVVATKGIFSISNEQNNIEKIFSKIPPEPIVSRVSIIRMTKVYKTYAQPIIRETVRSIITKYSIDEIMQNRQFIGEELSEAVNQRLKNTPIKASYFGLANIQPPDVIIHAQEAAKKREIAIKEAENEKMVSLKKAEAALEVAVKQQEVDLKEAETQVLVNKKLTEGVNQAFVTQRALKALMEFAQNDNKVILMPTEAFSNPAILLGAMKLVED